MEAAQVVVLVAIGLLLLAAAVAMHHRP